MSRATPVPYYCIEGTGGYLLTIFTIDLPELSSWDELVSLVRSKVVLT